jgi:hypothetical protein
MPQVASVLYRMLPTLENFNTFPKQKLTHI